MVVFPLTLTVFLCCPVLSFGTAAARPDGEQARQQAADPKKSDLDKLLTQLEKDKLDEIVSQAEKKATARLPAKVTSAAQALKHAPGKETDKSYRVLEHKGWWVVAWYGSGSEPFLWFNGVAIRKNSKDIYHFGSW